MQRQTATKVAAMLVSYQRKADSCKVMLERNLLFRNVFKLTPSKMDDTSCVFVGRLCECR